jgi:hypothetical protein
MNFENRLNVILPCPDLKSIAKNFYHRTFKGYGYQYGDFIFVDDRFCGQGDLEVVIVDQKKRLFIDSITVSWCKCELEVYNYFKAAINHTPIVVKEVKVPLCEEDLKDKRIFFECGCCGCSFKDTYENQKKFDQEEGYGICPKCSHNY